MECTDFPVTETQVISKKRRGERKSLVHFNSGFHDRQYLKKTSSYLLAGRSLLTGSTWQQAANDTAKKPAAQVTHEVSENDMRT